MTKAPPQAWNPRYANYARVHGKTPEEMLALDGERWPGGKMCGFVLWNSARVHEWKTLVGHPHESDLHGRPGKSFAALGMGGPNDHERYDAWLAALPVGHGLEDASPGKRDDRARDRP